MFPPPARAKIVMQQQPQLQQVLVCVGYGLRLGRLPVGLSEGDLLRLPV